MESEIKIRFLQFKDILPGPDADKFVFRKPREDQKPIKIEEWTIDIKDFPKDLIIQKPLPGQDQT